MWPVQLFTSVPNQSTEVFCNKHCEPDIEIVMSK